MIQALLWLSVFVALTIGEENKRLLINDPDVMAARLNHLESLVTTINKELQQEKVKRQTQERTMQQLMTAQSKLCNQYTI